MYPIHCAVLGGSIELVQWLVEQQMCTIVNKAKKSVLTSKNRTLIDLAMTGSNPLATLQYLVGRCGLSIGDVKDASLVPKTLDFLLKSTLHSTTTTSNADIVPALSEDSQEASLESLCPLCCERSCGDSVFVPCGHMVCCTECALTLHKCPICKVDCKVLRIFRQ